MYLLLELHLSTIYLINVKIFSNKVGRKVKLIKVGFIFTQSWTYDEQGFTSGKNRYYLTFLQAFR